MDGCSPVKPVRYSCYSSCSSRGDGDDGAASSAANAVVLAYVVLVHAAQLQESARTLEFLLKLIPNRHLFDLKTRRRKSILNRIL